MWAAACIPRRIIIISVLIRVLPRQRNWPDFLWSLPLPHVAISFDHMHPLSPVHFSSFQPRLVLSAFVFFPRPRSARKIQIRDQLEQFAAKSQRRLTEKSMFFLSWLTARGSGTGSVCLTTLTLSPER